MKYQECIEYLKNISSSGITLGLESIRTLCDKIGNPQNDLKFVHVAGTNGKGSTLAFVSTILKSAGYTVGRYISPVIFEDREKIQVNEVPISKIAMGEGVELIKKACEEMVASGMPHPTIFEVETALAFWYFKKKKCDIVVLETGMGGKLDATNIITNTLVSVIASVGMDHMAFLGDTLEKIAIQKAGIIKEDSIVVCMRQSLEVMNIMKETAREHNSCFVLSDAERADHIKYGIEQQTFNYDRYKHLKISLAGKHQIDNAILALDVVEQLKHLGYNISEDALREGLANTKWEGRMTVIGHRPLFIVDGAHNEDAAQKLAKSIDFYFTNKRIIYIMGMLKDKEYDKVINLTYERAAHIITITPPNNRRAMNSYDLAMEIAKVHSSVSAVDSLEEAVEMSYLLAGEDDVILAFGSLSYLGKLMEIVRNNSGSRKDKRSGKTFASGHRGRC